MATCRCSTWLVPTGVAKKQVALLVQQPLRIGTHCSKRWAFQCVLFDCHRLSQRMHSDLPGSVWLSRLLAGQQSWSRVSWAAAYYAYDMLRSTVHVAAPTCFWEAYCYFLTGCRWPKALSDSILLLLLHHFVQMLQLSSMQQFSVSKAAFCTADYMWERNISCPSLDGNGLKRLSALNTNAPRCVSCSHT
jgi:hypothetical protein